MLPNCFIKSSIQQRDYMEEALPITKQILIILQKYNSENKWNWKEWLEEKYQNT